MSNGYSSKLYQCPFFQWDQRRRGRTLIHCEGGRLTLPDREMGRHTRQYCASLKGWQQCQIAQALQQYYDRV